MILSDINILVYAHRKDTPDHDVFLEWLESTINSDQSYAVSTLVLSGFIRIVTHPKIFKQPSSLKDAFEFANKIAEQPNCIHVERAPDTGKYSEISVVLQGPKVISSPMPSLPPWLLNMDANGLPLTGITAVSPD